MLFYYCSLSKLATISTVQNTHERGPKCILQKDKIKTEKRKPDNKKEQKFELHELLYKTRAVWRYIGTIGKN